MEPCDGELSLRIRRGDAEAEAIFAERYAKRLRAMMFARTRNPADAEDLAQEALVAALEALRAGHIASPDHLGAFVHGVGRHVLANWARRKGRRPEEVALPNDLRARRTRSRVSRGSVVGRAIRGVAGLPTTDRAILVMSYWWRRSGATIAKTLGLRHDVVRARKARALRKLAVALRRRTT